ncbi:adenylate/guanylate cyclase domain-containing protein [Pelagibius sp. CAU 1746]|uniref:adenylate/guanylate cyclase domain-containing protein n=1 Tax=Pelagibius sp. CAU 1746 TaxID=3140370 RepID=UPI00325A62F2
MERRLAAIMSVDVVGYSRLMGQDEAGTLAALKAHRAELIDPTIAKHKGRLVKLMGDGALVEFPSAVDAVVCAAALQRGMAQRTAEHPEDRRIVFRIGINIGDLIVEGDDLYGDGVNIAARLEGLAEPGGICVSQHVVGQVKGKVDFGFEDLGNQHVKNIAEPIRVYRVSLSPKAAGKNVRLKKGARGAWRKAAVAAAAAVAIAASGAVAWLKPWQPTVEPASVDRMAFPLPEKPSIAVLPFVNMSGDPEQEYFTDGLTEDLITDLSSISGLFVISRNSTFVYKGRSVPARQVSEDLGVRYVLEGSVRRSGNEIRVNAQLIDATTGGNLWAERYDGPVASVFEVQDLFIREIVSALALNLSEGERKAFASGQTTNIQAREAFQKGWEHYLRYTAEDNAIAAEHLGNALEIDPGYGRAYAALGLVYVRGCQWRWHEELGTSPSGAFDTAVAYVTEGEANSSSLTKVAASQISLYDNQHDAALTEAARAVALDPNDPEAQVAMGLAMITTGKPEPGLAFIETALRLNPNHPSHYALAKALAYFAMNDLDQSATVLTQALTRNPDSDDLTPLLSASHARLGRRKDARDALLQWRPEANQAELERSVLEYHFPYKWSPEARDVEQRLQDGLKLSTLPLDVTVDTLIERLHSGDATERRSSVEELGLFGPLRPTRYRS